MIDLRAKGGVGVWKLVLVVALPIAAVLTLDRLLIQPHREWRELEAECREPVDGPSPADEQEAIDATFIVAEGEAEWPI